MDVFTGIVLLDKDKRIYLIKEEDKNQIGQNRWNLPGGSVDAGESIIESAQRETLEETGYQSAIKSVLGLYQGSKANKSWLYVVFEGEVDPHKQKPIADTSVKEGAWFDAEKFLNLDSSLLVHSDMKLVYQIAVGKKGLSLNSVKSINYD